MQRPHTAPGPSSRPTDGTTESTIGANEGCARFNVSDLTDAGFTNYRIYAGMSRVEPQDDDGVFGSPSIAQIQAGDSPSGPVRPASDSETTDTETTFHLHGGTTARYFVVWITKLSGPRAYVNEVTAR